MKAVAAAASSFAYAAAWASSLPLTVLAVAVKCSIHGVSSEICKANHLCHMILCLVSDA